ncbi:hypothetical protein, partial [Endozoicomonas acroporae]|uniref:hypothetical protein n=1 Tax=Endozoicomonas acroporae TaxID=1701104 RepID=UPI003D7C0D2D
INLKADGVIALNAAKNLEQFSEEKSKKGTFWQKAKGEGKTDETIVHTEITAENLTLEAGQGIQADIKQIDGKNLQQTIEHLSQKPELAWMQQLQENPNVDWAQVQEIHDSWDYESQGLTGPAAAIVVIVVTYLTAGAAAGAAGAISGAGAGGASAAAAAGVSATYAASYAATSSLIS